MDSLQGSGKCKIVHVIVSSEWFRGKLVSCLGSSQGHLFGPGSYFGTSY